VWIPTVAFWNNVFSNYSLVPFAVGLIAIFFFMKSFKRRMQNIGQANNRGSSLREPPSRGPEAGFRADLEQLLVELQELSRRISAEIDTRFAKLEASIRDADRRIAVLNRLTRQLENKKMDSDDPGVSGYDARHAVVYELADAGFSPVEIAKDLGKTPGEVELILNLRKQKES